MKHEDIAVIGVGALFPGAPDTGGFWRNILAGSDLITDVPGSHWLIEDYYDPDPTAPDKTYSKRGGFLPEVDFDPIAFAIPPANLKATDTSQLLALIVAQYVLADACKERQFKRVDRDKISVILGVASATELVVHMGGRIQRPFWAKALRDYGLAEREVERICDRIADLYVPWTESTFPGLLGNVVAGRIANHFDFHGTNTVADAACASSLSALTMAVMELSSGRSDMVITGGVDTLNDILMYMCFSKTTALSASGDCRPFSDRADGTLIGEGIGMVALKRLADAESHGDRIYAVIKGIGTSSDGKSKSIYAPRTEGQALALRRAYEQAGYEPETVELVEAHGTGTKAGDAAEFAGLASVFRSDRRKQWCALGSVKSQIGHTKAAAGTAGLFKAVMALHHKILPPTIKVDRPNPGLDIESSPFYLNTESRPWIRDGDFPRRASVSAFGFGGSNFHVTLEEYTRAEHRQEKWRALPTELFVFSADTAAELLAELRSFADAAAACPRHDYGSHAVFAKRSQMKFAHEKGYRVAAVAADLAELTDKLKLAIDHIRSAPDRPLHNHNAVYYDTRTVAGKIALLFPGQGSQYVNMGKELAMHFDVVREGWERSTELRLELGGDGAEGEDLNGDGADGEEPDGEERKALHAFVFPPPVFDEAARQRRHKRLTDTRIAQPAIGAMSLSLLRLLERLGLRADCAAGHSYGEITALAAAGVLSEHDMLRIAHKRGLLMHGAAKGKQGAMTAVMAEPETVRRLIESSALRVVIANYNSPTQVVVSGAEAEIVRLERELGRSSVRFVRLPVSTAFHSEWIEPAVAPFAEFLEGVPFQASHLPVYANVTGEPYPEETPRMRELLAGQLSRPVRFIEQIRNMAASGVELFIEVGPDDVLTGLVNRILAGGDAKAIALDHRGQPGVVSLWHALAKLSVWGISLDFGAIWEGFRLKREPTGGDKPGLRVKIGGTNHGKPYPASKMNVPASNTNVPAPKANASPSQTNVPASKMNVPDTERQVIYMEDRNRHQQQPTIVKTHAETERPVSSAAFIQRQMTEAHLAFQKALTESHHAYLRSTEMLLSAMAGQLPMMEPLPMPDSYTREAQETAWLNGYAETAPTHPTSATDKAPAAYQPPMEHQASAAYQASVEHQAPVAYREPATHQAPVAHQASAAYQAPVADQVPAEHQASAVYQAPVIQGALPPSLHGHALPAYPAAPELRAEPAAAAEHRRPAPAEAQESPDIKAIMLEVVAEKTGYPQEMLDMELDLESGLGIDSIKRVEILSTVQDKVADLPAFDPSELAGLFTLNEIVGFMEQKLKKN